MCREDVHILLVITTQFLMRQVCQVEIDDGIIEVLSLLQWTIVVESYIFTFVLNAGIAPVKRNKIMYIGMEIIELVCKLTNLLIVLIFGAKCFCLCLIVWDRDGLQSRVWFRRCSSGWCGQGRSCGSVLWRGSRRIFLARFRNGEVQSGNMIPLKDRQSHVCFPKRPNKNQLFSTIKYDLEFNYISVTHRDLPASHHSRGSCGAFMASSSLGKLTPSYWIAITYLLSSLCLI